MKIRFLSFNENAAFAIVCYCLYCFPYELLFFVYDADDVLFCTASVFAGAAVANRLLRPDLTIPDVTEKVRAEQELEKAADADKQRK